MLPLAVSWKASGHAARGFYHPEEERLVVTVRSGGAFASYIDAGCVQLDLDQTGAFVGLTVETPREKWPVVCDLWAPRVAIPATVHFPRRSLNLDGARLATDPDRRWLRIDFSDRPGTHVIEPCENVCFELADHHLVRIWIMHIHDDHDFSGLRAWKAAG